MKDISLPTYPSYPRPASPRKPSILGSYPTKTGQLTKPATLRTRKTRKAQATGSFIPTCAQRPATLGLLQPASRPALQHSQLSENHSTLGLQSQLGRTSLLDSLRRLIRLVQVPQLPQGLQIHLHMARRRRR